jgi:hypothetical protein
MVYVMALSINFIHIKLESAFRKSDKCDLVSKYGINPAKWKLFTEMFRCKRKREVLLQQP